MTAVNFAQALGSVFGARAETDVHLHVPEERAGLYHAIDDTSTELEVLNFLNAVVYLFKPQTTLETGSYHGFGALAIAAGLKLNGAGKLISVESKNPNVATARRNIRRFDPDLLDYIIFEESQSTVFLETYSGPAFELAFLDSSIEDRVPELQILLERKLLAEDAVCVVHDTSRHRVEYDDPSVFGANLHGLDYLDGLSQDFSVSSFLFRAAFGSSN